MQVILFARRRPAPPEWFVGGLYFKGQLDIGIIYPSEKSLIDEYFKEETEFNAYNATPYLDVPSLLLLNDVDTLQGEWRKLRGLEPEKFISLLASLANQVYIIIYLFIYLFIY